MKFWVTQWQPDQDDTENVLCSTPEDMWSTCKSMAERYPDQSIIVLDADS